MKGKIAKTNMAVAAEKGRSMDVIKNLCEEVLSEVTPDLWKKCVNHAKKIEDYYWKNDHLVEDIPVPPVIVDMNCSTTDDSDNVDSPDTSENDEL